RGGRRPLAPAGTERVVTVGGGTAGGGEAGGARRLGLELVVTDHHEPKEALPGADALVHPRLPGHDYPFGGLSGSGVAFKVAWLLCQRASGGERGPLRLRDFLLDSVALAARELVAEEGAGRGGRRGASAGRDPTLRPPRPAPAARGPDRRPEGAVGGGRAGRGRGAAGRRHRLQAGPAAERGRPARLRPAGGRAADH